MPEDFSEEFFITYSLNEPDKDGKLIPKVFRTDAKKGDKGVINFGYIGRHFYSELTPEVLDYLLNQNLCFEVHGFPMKKKAGEESERGFGESQNFDKHSLTRGQKKEETERTGQSKAIETAVFTTGNSPGDSDLINEYNSKLLQAKHLKSEKEKSETDKPADKKEKKEKKKRKSGFFSFLGL